MKILFLPNWHVDFLQKDNINIQAPNKLISKSSYWFFRYTNNVDIEIIDNQIQNPFHKIEKNLLKTYFYQPFKAFLRRNQYDVVLSHGAQSGLFYSFLVTLFGGKKNPLNVIIDVGGMNGSRINKLETPAIRFALKNKPFIISHSKSQLSFYKEAFPDLDLKTHFIKFGVDNVYFNPDPNIESENYILSFGYARRDYQTLLTAWDYIETNCKLKIIGVNGISTDKVEYVGESSLKQLINAIYKSQFVVIPLPVYNHSYGQMSFLQSMALGKPVIVTQTPSSIDYLIDGQGSFFVKPYDSKDLSEKITYLLDHKDKLPELGVLARKQIDDRLNEKIMAIEIVNAISDELELTKYLAYENSTNK